jgi:hypothetical protein
MTKAKKCLLRKILDIEGIDYEVELLNDFRLGFKSNAFDYIHCSASGAQLVSTTSPKYKLSLTSNSTVLTKK